MHTGIIANKMEGKEFGFIKVEGQPKDFFFHRSGVTDPVGFDGLKGNTTKDSNDGDKVTFDTQTGQDGRISAINVMKAS